jgi:hypothetical protein
MNILKESYSIDTSVPGFVHVQYTQLVDNGVDMGGHMWFERANLPWVVDALKTCINVYATPRVALQAGQDSLSVSESGHEQQPFIGLRNRRPADAPHPGAFAVSLTKPLATQFVDELDKL